MDEEWLSITEAARRLTEMGDVVDRSTLSRYISQHGEALPIRVAGKAKLVELGALHQHRHENIRIRSMPPEARSQGNAKEPAPRFRGSQADAAARDRMAQAEMREIELAKIRRQLTPLKEVDRAGRDAVALMQSAFERAIDGDAAALSVKYGWDERTVRLALKQFSRTGLDVFHNEIHKRLDQMRRARDLEDDQDDQGDLDQAMNAPLQ